MKILAFDTTNSTLSTAILSDNKIVSQINIVESNKQAEMLIPSIEQCLKKAQMWYDDLNLIAFTNGPGSFTGIRVGYSCAQALRISTNIPILTINSLEAIAYPHRNGNYQKKQYNKILVVNDAKLDEIFIQEFDLIDSKLNAAYETKLINIEESPIFSPEVDFLLVGSAKNIILPFMQRFDNCILSKEEDFIDAGNIALLSEELYNKNYHYSNGPLYIRKPKISKRKNSP